MRRKSRAFVQGSEGRSWFLFKRGASKVGWDDQRESQRGHAQPPRLEFAALIASLHRLTRCGTSLR